ncbi:Brp/Blh family beta-carotene 15,15'-dioxygenase [Aquirufa sp. HETE-40SA]
MKNYIGAFVTLIYLAAYLLLGPWSSSIDLIICGSLLLLIGIPHGAGDHLIAQKIASRENLTFHLKHFIVYYLGIMLAYAALWFITPVVGFIIFIAISVFHFGDMEDVHPVEPTNTWLNLVKTICLGSGILSFILVSHWSEVLEITTSMQVNLPKNLPPFSLLFSLFFLSFGFQKKNFHPFLNTFFALVIGFSLPLIPAFICYFSCCHAITSFEGMRNHLKMKIWELYKKLIPFSIGAFLLGIVYMKLIANNLQVYPIFIFLSLLTLPHFLLMHKLIKRPI